MPCQSSLIWRPRIQVVGGTWQTYLLPSTLRPAFSESSKACTSLKIFWPFLYFLTRRCRAIPKLYPRKTSLVSVATRLLKRLHALCLRPARPGGSVGFPRRSATAALATVTSRIFVPLTREGAPAARPWQPPPSARSIASQQSRLPARGLRFAIRCAPQSRATGPQRA